MHPMEMLNNKIRDTDDRFTKREYIAAQMLQGLIPLQSGKTINNAAIFELCKTAIQMSDILIQELRTKPAGAVK